MIVDYCLDDALVLLTIVWEKVSKDNWMCQLDELFFMYIYFVEGGGCYGKILLIKQKPEFKLNC